MADPFDRPDPTNRGAVFTRTPNGMAGNMSERRRFGERPAVGYQVGEHIIRAGPSPTVAGVVTGLTDVPLAGWVFRRALTESGLVDQEALEELARTADSDPFGKGARFAASFIPELMVTGGMMSAARRMALVGMGKAAPAAARILGPGNRFTPKLNRMAAWSTDTGGMGPVGLPMFARFGETAAGAAAGGSVYAADALLEGSPINEAAYQGLLAGGLIGGSEVGIMGMARALGVRPPINARALKEHFTKSTAEVRAVSGARLQEALERTQQQLYDAGINSQAERMAGLKGREARRASDIAAAEGFWELPAYRVSYLRDRPKAHAGVLDEVALRWWKTPERMGQELGVSGGKAITLAQDYLQHKQISDNIDHRELGEMVNDFAAAFGRRSGSNRHLVPLIHAYQRGGVKGAEAAARVIGQVRDPNALRQGLRHMDEFIAARNTSLGQLGLREAVEEPGRSFFPLIIKAQVPRNTVMGRLFGVPQSPEVVVKQFEDALVKLGRSRVDAEALAEDLTTRAAHKAPDLLNKELNNLTLDEALAAGVPVIDDPFVALQVWSQAANRRVAYTTRFGHSVHTKDGYQGIVIRDVIRPAVAAEGGSVRLFDLMMDSVSGGHYPGMLTNAAAEAITNGQVAARMGTSVFANMTQPVNTIVNAGIGNFLKGVAYTKKGRRIRATTDADIAASMEALALRDSMITSWREAALDPLYRTPLGKFADRILYTTGFTAVERFNRLSGAAAGMHDVSKTLAQGIAGNLRGKTLDAARRRLNGYGLDLDDMIAQGRAIDSDPAAAARKMLLANDAKLMKDAGMGAAKRTQFIPDATRRPLDWTTPAGRILTQFKSFAVSQTRFLRDQVLGEAAAGNYRPLSYYLAFAPLAGEFVVDMRNLVTGRGLERPDNLVMHVAENLMAVGGLGLGGELFRAAVFGPSNIILESAAGPTVTDLANGVEYIMSGQPDQLVERMRRMGTIRAGMNVGMATAAILAAGAKAAGEQPDVRRFEQALRHYVGQSEAEGAPTLHELMLGERE